MKPFKITPEKLEGIKDAVDSEFSIFGFLTAQVRRGFITAVFVMCIVAIVYLAYDNRNLNNELVKTKEDQRRTEQVLYEKLLIYFQPKLQLLDSSTKELNQSVIKHDSIQIQIYNNIKK